MATVITKKQVQEINNKCSSDWKFDTEFYIFHSMKTLSKKLKIDDTGYFAFRLDYNNENQVTLNIKRFNYKDGVSVAEKAKNIILDKKVYSRISPSKLLDFADKLTDDELLKLYAENK